MIKEIFKKYENIISYAFFGVLTTVVNIIVYFVFFNVISINNILSTVIAWIFAVLFAFLTNKRYVFKSKSWKKEIALKESSSFFLCRVATGIVEILFMYISVDIFLFNGTAMKVLTNIIVIVLNYIVSKLYIFKENKYDKK